MSFNSTTFIVFFLVVFFAYWAVSRTARLRFALLFVASCVFYMSWNPKFIVLIFASTALDYYVGAAIHRTENAAKRRFFLCLSLAGNLSLLGFFKYFNFFLESFHDLLRALGLGSTEAFVPWDIVLPVGISFYTFQTLSYTLDIYRRQLEPVDSLLKFALFVAFFPQLVAGPIVRAADFLPQLNEPARYDDGAAGRGVFLIMAGLIKKVALADTIGLHLVDPVFKAPGDYGPIQILVAVWGTLFQFYLDFSAYSDIAIGAAACLGFRLPVNFDRPFLSQDLAEFWRRWHISMTSFFRDYVFISLGGTRCRTAKIVRNFFITFVLVGLWHGAGWNYVVWGVLIGIPMMVRVFMRQPTDEERAARSLFGRVWRRAWVFNFHSLCIMIFRNGTVAEGNRGIQGTLDMLSSLVDFGAHAGRLSPLGLRALALAAVIHFAPKAWVHVARDRFTRLPALGQAVVMVLVTGCLAAMAYEQAPFIYFQF
ncbi:MAG: MBOAT family protein [Planctomycetes bacterium]|nr:MBOAT family protein [Planctomycetota bacterium]